MEKISIIIPVYNSEASLEALNKEIDTYFKHGQYFIEKIFVDDCSQDKSMVILETITKNAGALEQIKVIGLKRNVGQQNALFCGLQYASGDYIVTMDDDLQHDISYVDQMIERLKNGADLVYGVHAMDTYSTRGLGSKMTGFFFKKRFKVLKGKRVSSFRAFKQSLGQSIKSKHYKFIYLSALLLREANQVENIQIIKRQRPYGKSGYNLIKLTTLFLKLNYYYGVIIPEWMKAKGEPYEEINVTGGGQLPAECH